MVHGDLRRAWHKEQQLADASRPGETALPREVCEYPGKGGSAKPRVVFVLADSMRFRTATDAKFMPWLVKFQKQSVYGKVEPCMSQLTLTCVRCIFEGREPIVWTGFANFTGMRVEAPNLFRDIAGRGAKIAAASDVPFISLYRPWLAEAITIEDRPEDQSDRDLYVRRIGDRWVDDRSLGYDFIYLHLMDTDAHAHHYGVHSVEYRDKYRDTDRWLSRLAGRLGPNDTLFIAGDHGHDDKGYHSTGIRSSTVYFVKGPRFVAGRRLDMHIRSIYSLVTAATCQVPPRSYRGLIDQSVLRGDPTFFAAYREKLGQHLELLSGRGERVVHERLRRADEWIPIALIVLALLWYLWIARTGQTDALWLPTLANLTMLGPGLVFFPATALWLAAGLNLFIALLMAAQQPQLGKAGVLLAVGLLYQAGAGIVVHRLLVMLQSHGEAGAILTFLGSSLVIILALSLLTRSYLQHDTLRASGLTALCFFFFGLFMGPYYYGWARWLLLGVGWLLISWAMPLVWQRRWDVLRWLLVALAAAAPFHGPRMKEWKLRYFMLEFADSWNVYLVVGLVAGVLAITLLIIPSRRHWVRLVLPALAMVPLGKLTDFPTSAVLGMVALIISYHAFCGCLAAVARHLDDTKPKHPDVAPKTISPWVLPLGQVAYLFMLYFTLFRGIRMSNIDFTFALQLVSVEGGEGRATLVALPLMFIKYGAPLIAMLIAGAACTARLTLLTVYKLGAMVLLFAVMDVVNHPSGEMFRQLQGQQVLLCCFLLLVSVVASASGLGWRQETS